MPRCIVCGMQAREITRKRLGKSNGIRVHVVVDGSQLRNRRRVEVNGGSVFVVGGWGGLGGELPGSAQRLEVLKVAATRRSGGGCDWFDSTEDNPVAKIST